jgi:CBS domain-containing protein
MRESLNAVSDVMRSGVVSVSESTSVAAVARVMREHRVHGVLVIADDGTPRGWVTARGMLRHDAACWGRLKACEAVSEPYVTVVPSAGVPEAIQKLLDSEATRLAVMRPGSRTPDGVVSDIDLVAHFSH